MRPVKRGFVFKLLGILLPSLLPFGSVSGVQAQQAPESIGLNDAKIAWLRQTPVIG